MRRNGLVCAALAAILLAVGCSDDSKDALPAAKAPTDAGVGVATPAVATPASAPAAQSGPAANSEPLEPQLAPIQSALQAFEQQNNRMPVNVEEMVKAGVLKEMPKAPAGKLYVIDQVTKKVRFSSSP